MFATIAAVGVSYISPFAAGSGLPEVKVGFTVLNFPLLLCIAFVKTGFIILSCCLFFSSWKLVTKPPLELKLFFASYMLIFHQVILSGFVLRGFLGIVTLFTKTFTIVGQATGGGGNGGIIVLFYTRIIIIKQLQFIFVSPFNFEDGFCCLRSQPWKRRYVASTIFGASLFS